MMNIVSIECATTTNNPLPVIAGVEIAVDAEGRFNLNVLHRASGSANKDRPLLWLENEQTKKLIEELSRNSCLGFEPVNSVKGGKAPGTFAAEQLAVAYAVSIDGGAE